MTRRIACSLFAAVAVCGAAAAPASAVVGGSPLDAATVPWLADVSGCGGTLVAPDRVVTAAHCVQGRNLVDLGHIRLGADVLRPPTRYAVHPGWKRLNGEIPRHDVALVEFAPPVTDVAPVALGDAVPGSTAIIAGRGRNFAPGTGHDTVFGGSLASAPLRVMTDAECRRTFGRERGNGGERFIADLMVCAIDGDGRAPLSSGCNGDSGGPLYSQRAGVPVLLGIVSWGGTRCGADHLPSVFSDPRRYERFIGAASPVWAPEATGPATISGRAEPGGVLRCTVPGWRGKPSRVDFTWQREGGRRARIIRGATYRVRAKDAGAAFTCVVSAENAGGRTAVKFTPSAKVRIAR